MIKYIIQGKKNPLKKTEIKYYPQMAPSTPMTLAQIVKRVKSILRFHAPFPLFLRGKNTYS